MCVQVLCTRIECLSSFSVLPTYYNMFCLRQHWQVINTIHTTVIALAQLVGVVRATWTPSSCKLCLYQVVNNNAVVSSRMHLFIAYFTISCSNILVAPITTKLLNEKISLSRYYRHIYQFSFVIHASSIVRYRLIDQQ